ncbi:MAG: glycosyltransferase family 4 protein [Nitrospiraceae bacterium]|nr:glycosyltransferase family 4 protein [Nitrospiraceae bacterium]
MSVLNSPGFNAADIDCVLDARSIGLEHWSYNLGIARQILATRVPRATRLIMSPACSALLGALGVPAEERREAGSTGSRLLRLLAREWHSARTIREVLRSNDHVLIVHVHPLALCLAALKPPSHKGRLSVCLHNDFMGAARGAGTEDRIERLLWRTATRLHRGLRIVAPNRHFARFARLLFPRGTGIDVLPHPVLSRSDYERVAASSPLANGERFTLGFFGRVDPGRGAGDFREWAVLHPDNPCVLAGRWTNRLEPLPNLRVFDLPDTHDFCALILRTDALFLDLRDDAYRVGESGVFWDAVGTRARLRCGYLPLMYRQRLVELAMQPNGPVGENP